MEIKTLKVGYLQTNCYILIIDKDAIIIDPGDEYEKINEVIKPFNLRAILITHNHFDHIGALNKFKNIPIYKYENIEEKKYNINKFEFDVIFTGGHTSDSVTYYFKKEKTMFVGDFIFKNSIGRTDLETGNMQQMQESIKKIITYPKETKLKPGHGKATTQKDELQGNLFLFI